MALGDEPGPSMQPHLSRLSLQHNLPMFLEYSSFAHLRAFAQLHPLPLIFTCLPPLGPHVLAEMPHLSRKGLPNFPSFCFTVFVALSTIGNCLVICLSGFFALSFHHCTLPSASAGQAHIEAQ